MRAGPYCWYNYLLGVVAAGVFRRVIVPWGPPPPFTIGLSGNFINNFCPPHSTPCKDTDTIKPQNDLNAFSIMKSFRFLCHKLSFYLFLYKPFFPSTSHALMNSKLSKHSKVLPMFWENQLYFQHFMLGFYKPQISVNCHQI